MHQDYTNQGRRPSAVQIVAAWKRGGRPDRFTVEYGETFAEFQLVGKRWDDSGNGTPIVTVQYFTSRTYTGDAFWTRLGIEVTPAGLVRVRGSLRWDGAVTAA